jgi:hypothetical protein
VASDAGLYSSKASPVIENGSSNSGSTALIKKDRSHERTASIVDVAPTSALTQHTRTASPTATTANTIRSSGETALNTGEVQAADGVETTLSEPSASSSAPGGEHTDEITGELSTPATRNGQVIFAVPDLAFSALEISHEEIQPVTDYTGTPLKVNKRKTRADISPFAATSALGSWNGGGGIYAGAGMDVKFGHRWGVHAGLGYGSFDPSLSFISDDALAPEEMFDNGGIIQTDNTYLGYENYILGESINNNPSYTALDPIVEYIRQWSGTFGITYNLTKRWFAQSGVMVSFNTSAHSQYPIISADINSTPTAVKVSHSLDSYEVIRHSMSSVYGGIGYHIGRHIDLYTQVVYGFQPYLLGSEVDSITGMPAPARARKDYIRGVSLGLKYTL